MKLTFLIYIKIYPTQKASNAITFFGGSRDGDGIPFPS